MSRKPTAIRLSPDKNTNDEPVRKLSKKKSDTKIKAGKSVSKKVENGSTRAPKVLPSPKVEKSDPDTFDQSPFAENQETIQVPSHLPDMSRGIKWGSIMLAAVLALFSIGFSLWAVELVEAFFARNPVLGWISLGLVALFALSLLVLVLKEFIAIRRLKKIGNIRQDVEQVLFQNGEAKPVLSRLITLYASRNDMHWHLEKLRSHDDDIMDEEDKVLLTEKTLMSPLDQEAKQIIAATAKRVSVITALNPSAVLDIIFVGYQITNMLRKLMALYGGRPAFFAAMKLIRMVATHLAVTGGLAVSDTILQQVLGKGLAGTLSRKVGEGTVNGIMATRIGIAAIDLCRPLPFKACEQPNLKGFISDLVGGKLN